MTKRTAVYLYADERYEKRNIFLLFCNHDCYADDTAGEVTTMCHVFQLSRDCSVIQKGIFIPYLL